MKPFERLRKRELAVCLTLALAVGLPIQVGSAAKPLSSAAHFQPVNFLDNAQARPSPRSSSPLGITFISNCDDSGPGSLRDAVGAATDGDHIDLRALACSTITLNSAIAVGAIDLYIDGPGRDRLTIDGGGSTRLFETDYHLLTLTGLRLANGYASGDGGCILSAGYVQLTDTVITGCQAHAASVEARGGAIFAIGVGLLHASVVSNVATSDSDYAKGGGFYAQDTESLYSTIDSNEARSSSSQGIGGGAFVTRNAIFDGVAITRNHAAKAGGLSLSGNAAYNTTIGQSTISENVADEIIGGVYMASSAVVGSTIAFNCANQTQGPGGYTAGVGVEVQEAVAFFYSTIVSNNGLCAPAAAAKSPQGSADDLALRGAGGIFGSNNLVVTSNTTLPPDTIRADPMLGPLADNGGDNETHALLPGSPAIDAGSSEFALPWDGRWHWFARINGPAPDIGAFESDPVGNVLVASSCDDSGAGTLRDLAAAAISGDTIDLTELPCSRITLTSGAIVLGQTQNNLKIVGPGSELLTIDGNAHDRIFLHGGSGRFELDGMALQNGYYASTGYARGGGCILSFGLVAGSDTTFESCVAHTATTACYGGAIRAGGIMLDGTRIADSRCSSDGGSAGGGGIAVDYELVLTNATLANNTAETGPALALGGGFFAKGEADISYSTISGNAADIAAGGYAPKLVVSESTISGNTADVTIGGLGAAMGALYNSTVAFNASSRTTYDVASGLFVMARGDLESSIFFGNTLGADAYDVGTSLGALFGANDLVGYSARALPAGTIHDDPLLGPLQDNGGPTQTHALGDGSPAINAGNNDAGFEVDQRGAGFARVVGAAADIGAFEVQAPDRIFSNGFDP